MQGLANDRVNMCRLDGEAQGVLVFGNRREKAVKWQSF